MSYIKGIFTVSFAERKKLLTSSLFTSQSVTKNLSYFITASALYGHQKPRKVVFFWADPAPFGLLLWGTDWQSDKHGRSFHFSRFGVCPFSVCQFIIMTPRRFLFSFLDVLPLDWSWETLRKKELMRLDT